MTPIQPAGAALESLIAIDERIEADLDRKDALLRDIAEWMDRGQGSSTEGLLMMIKERKTLRAAISKELT